MKNCRVSLAALFSIFCVSSNAQIFIEGAVGFTNSKSETDNGISTSKTTQSTFSFWPGAGKFISEKVAIGINLDINYELRTSGPTPDRREVTTSMGASPFVRYYALTWNKLSVFGQGDLGFSFDNTKETVDGTKSDGPQGSTYYFRVTPGLSYDISDRLQLQTSIHILSLGYYYYKSEDGSLESSNSGFTLGANMNNIFTIGDITVGAIFKF